MRFMPRSLAPLAMLLVFHLMLLLSPQFAGAQTSREEAKIKDLLSRLTLQEEIRMLSGSSMMATTPIERLHIPAFRMTDGPHGGAHSAAVDRLCGRYWPSSVVGPRPGPAGGGPTGRDARSRGASFLLGPGVNIYRAR